MSNYLELPNRHRLLDFIQSFRPSFMCIVAVLDSSVGVDRTVELRVDMDSPLPHSLSKPPLLPWLMFWKTCFMESQMTREL